MNQSKLIQWWVLLLLGLTASLVFFSCKEDEEQPKLTGTYYGESAAFGTATAKSFVELDRNIPVAVGVFITGIDLENMSEHELAVSLDLPTELKKTGLTHLLFDWMPHGHEPNGVFDRPHFDFHLYYATEAERLAITAGDTVKLNRHPEPGYIPGDFVPSVGIPQMGLHWIDSTDPVFTGGPFQMSFIYGSYDREVTFLESMIDKEYIEIGKAGGRPIKQPGKYPKPGNYYPSRYEFSYSPAAKELYVFMSYYVER
jgi:hypothetical protein